MLAAMLIIGSSCKSKPEPPAQKKPLKQQTAVPSRSKTEESASTPSNPSPADSALDTTPAQDHALTTKQPTDPAELPEDIVVRYIKFNQSDSGAAQTIHQTVSAITDEQDRLSSFLKLAKKHSTVDPAHRGQIELFKNSETDEDFFRAASAIPVGTLSPLIKTNQGHYIIWRLAKEAYSTAHILISYRGAKLAPPAIRRSKKSALMLAKQVAEDASASPSKFTSIASKKSDSPSSHRGGILAPIRPETLIDGFEPYLEAARKLEEGSISEVVETPYGFHIIKRLPLQSAEVQHILVTHRGSRGENHSKRPKGEASKIIRDLKRQLINDEMEFEALCKAKSEDRSAADGGKLPPFYRGEMNPIFERYAFSTPVGKLSRIFETDLGYHIIRRIH